MHEDTAFSPEGNTPKPLSPTTRRRILALCLLILAASVVGAVYIKRSTPQARQHPLRHTAIPVSIRPLYPGPHQIMVPAMGTVVPALEVTLKSRVSGEVKSTHPEFVEGGLLRAGQKVLKIDSQDYQLAITRQESAVANAEYALKVEMGHQDVARREWALLNSRVSVNSKDAELALRKPHLAKAQADLSAAMADLAQAQLNLLRTDVTAPFNAVVRVKNVSVGSQITTGDSLAELVGTDTYWIQVSLPVERLPWIRIPQTRQEKGAEVTIFYRQNQCRGTVFRQLSDLSSQGRMARILVAVKDPLGLSTKNSAIPPLLIGEYVRVEIQGRILENVYRIPRTAFHDNNTLWIAADNDTLAIMPVETIWRDVDQVIVKDGIIPGQRLVVSDLATPVSGMRLDVKTTAPVESIPDHFPLILDKQNGS